MNEVGQASVGEHDEAGDGAGNSLGVSLAGGRGVSIDRVSALVTVLGAAASGDQLNAKRRGWSKSEDILGWTATSG